MTTPIPTALPSYVGTGLVLGHNLEVGSDTIADADTNPDAFYPQGSTFTFTPSVQYLVFPKSVAPPDGAVVYLDPFTAKVSSSGQITTMDGGPLYPVANIGQNGNAQTWFWTVTPKISGRQLPSFQLDVTVGATSYLSDQQPIPSAVASSSLLRGPAGPAGAGGVGAPPTGTPDGYVPVASGGSSLWVDPSTQPWVGGGGVTAQYNDDGTVTIAEGATARNIIYQHGVPTDPTLYAIGTFIFNVDTGILYEITP